MAICLGRRRTSLSPAVALSIFLLTAVWLCRGTMQPPWVCRAAHVQPRLRGWYGTATGATRGISVGMGGAGSQSYGYHRQRGGRCRRRFHRDPRRWRVARLTACAASVDEAGLNYRKGRQLYCDPVRRALWRRVCLLRPVKYATQPSRLSLGLPQLIQSSRRAMLRGVVLVDMAFSVAVPTNDEGAEAKIAAAYATDPGASPAGKYVSTDEAIKDAVNHPNLRFLVIGNKHDCLEPISDYYPSPGNNNSKLTLAHPWQKPNATTIGVGKDVMGGNGAGEMSATCYYWGLELHTTQKIPIGLIHSSYGGSAVEDWISKETLGTGGYGVRESVSSRDPLELESQACCSPAQSNQQVSWKDHVVDGFAEPAVEWPDCPAIEHNDQGHHLVSGK